jgi:hypothetical protein
MVVAMREQRTAFFLAATARSPESCADTPHTLLLPGLTLPDGRLVAGDAMVSMIVAPVLGLAGLSVEARQRHPRMANARRFLSTQASVFNKDDISNDFIKTLEGKNSMAKVKAFLSLFDGASNKAICNLGKAIALDILFQRGAARAVAHPSQMHHFDVIYFMQRIGRQTESDRAEPRKRFTSRRRTSRISRSRSRTPSGPRTEHRQRAPSNSRSCSEPRAS